MLQMRSFPDCHFHEPYKAGKFTASISYIPRVMSLQVSISGPGAVAPYLSE